MIGWREWVGLPSLGDALVKAKIDTGARTSALHAFDLSLVESNDELFADFEIHPLQDSREGVVRVREPVIDLRKIRSSNGQIETRPVIEVPARIGTQEFDIQLTLTSRDEMGFRMLIGRRALRRRFVVDAARSFLGQPAPPPA